MDTTGKNLGGGRRALGCGLCAKRRALGCLPACLESTRHTAPLTRPSDVPLRGSGPGQGSACTVRVEAGEGERVRACGFEPAKALVRGLLLPQPPPFQLRLGYQLPPFRPIRGVGARARPLIRWLQMGGVLVGGWGLLPAQCWDLDTCRRVLSTHKYFDQKDPFGISAGIYSLPYGSSRVDLEPVVSALRHP